MLRSKPIQHRDTLVCVRFAIGTVSVSEPESELNPPPCRLISTRSRRSAGTSSGVITRTGTPAIDSLATCTGYIVSDNLPAPACHVSVPVRRASSVSGLAASDWDRKAFAGPPDLPSSAQE